MKIAFCASEVFPFAKTGGLADVCGALPIALEKIGVESVVFLPRYQSVDASKFALRKINQGLSQARLGKNIDVYFIESKQYFGRDGLYGNSTGDYPDNLERFQFFCEAVLKTIVRLKLKVDLFHCHDWQTALIPFYVKESDRFRDKFAGVKTILTIHNMAFQGVFPGDRFGQLGIKKDFFHQDFIEFFGQLNLLKAGIVFSDLVTSVSPQYAKEIQTGSLGCGLDSVLKAKHNDVIGILNGIDYDIWNPKADPWIAEPYSGQNYWEGKVGNKESLQKKVGLPVKKDVPVFGLVGRLSYQKGIDLILDILDKFLLLDVQLVIQGVGEDKYYKRLEEVQSKFPDKFRVCLEFDEGLAHQIYAGSDAFLMPSRYEPCGLSQMISLRFGTIPIVFKTGGLADSIQEFDPQHMTGNGFLFDQYTKEHFLSAINRALKSLQNERHRQALMANAFKSDFSWEHSANEYKKTYQCLLSV